MAPLKADDPGEEKRGGGILSMTFRSWLQTKSGGPWAPALHIAVTSGHKAQRLLISQDLVGLDRQLR